MRASRLSISILCVLISACGAARPIKYYKLEIPSPPPSPAGTGFASRFRSAISRRLRSCVMAGFSIRLARMK